MYGHDLNCECCQRCTSLFACLLLLGGRVHTSPVFSHMVVCWFVCLVMHVPCRHNQSVINSTAAAILEALVVGGDVVVRAALSLYRTEGNWDELLDTLSHCVAAIAC
jgi:hypothetical protein